MAFSFKINLKKHKYVLHSLSSVLIIPEYTFFDSLIDLFLYAYENCIDFSIIVSNTRKEFTFKVSGILDGLPYINFDTYFDQFFLGFVSLLLTTKERDKFKKKLRSYKNV